MTTIHIFLNNGNKLELPCNVTMAIEDVHTLAKQISESGLVYSTRVGAINYRNGKEEV